MNIIIGGDIVVRENNIDNFSKNEIKSIMEEDLYNKWRESDYRIFNLEAPITKSNNKILKCGPNLKISPDAINGIKGMNPSIICLANNHILDYGDSGLRDTVKLLKENNIKFIGIGENTDNLLKYSIINKNGKKIVIYNCCEHEFSGATSNSAGAYEIDTISIWNELQELKKINDYVIVIFHGGKEHYRYPSPYLQRLCRNMIIYGADLVTCQHSHCIGCYEKYKDGMIVYGQGNFIFDGQDNQYWNNAILLEIKINSKFSVNFIPIVKTSIGTRLANSNESEEILKEFEYRSKEIENNTFIIENYKKFAKEKIYDYLLSLHGNNIFYKVLNKIFKGKFAKIFYRKKSLISILNYIECEAHKELLIEGIKEIIYKKEK